MKYLFFNILILSFFLLFLSCSENSTGSDIDLSKFVFKSLENDMQSGEEGIVFISDTDGNILAEAEWSGDATIELKKADGTDLPERLNFTRINIDIFGTVYIYSNLNLKTKKWTTKGTSYPGSGNYAGEVQLNFNNIPNHQGYSVVSSFRSRGSTSGTLYSKAYNIYLNPDNFFISLSIPDWGKRYHWLTDVQAGNTYDVDLGNMADMKMGFVNLPDQNRSHSLYLSGYLTTNDRTGVSYVLDRYNHYDDTFVSQMPYYYVETPFEEYCSRMYMDDEEENSYWYNVTYGSPATNFNKINADFDFGVITNSTAKINTTGEFDQLATYWFSYTDDKYFYWNVYSGSGDSEHYLPKLPQMVYDKFPGLLTNSFQLGGGQISDYIGASSYDSFIEKSFGSAVSTEDAFDELRSLTRYVEEGGLAKKARKNIDHFDDTSINPYYR